MDDPATLNKYFEAACRAEFERYRAENGKGLRWMPVNNPRWWFDRYEAFQKRWREYSDVFATEWWGKRGYKWIRKGNEVFVEHIN